MQNQVSPWPWRLYSSEIGVQIVDARGKVIAGGKPNEGGIHVDSLDAQLMIGAPQLLDALRNVIEATIGLNENPDDWDEGSAFRKALELLAKFPWQLTQLSPPADQ